jgi:hypothetical protein
MLYVIIQPPFDEIDPQSVEFEIGKTTPVNLNHELVLSVIADGAELRHILNNFTQLPRCLSRTEQRWFGDHAKFIVANWT